VTRPPAWRSGARASSAQAARLAAALQSLSTMSSQQSQAKIRSANAIRSFFAPHREQVLLDANQRSQVTSSAPNHSALYASCRVNSDHAAFPMARARRLLWTRLVTARSSMANRAWFLTS
jgi:hypothetical protein